MKFSLAVHPRQGLRERWRTSGRVQNGCCETSKESAAHLICVLDFHTPEVVFAFANVVHSRGEGHTCKIQICE